MSPLEMKKVFEDLREEVLALAAEQGSDLTLLKTLSKTPSLVEGSQVEGLKTLSKTPSEAEGSVVEGVNEVWIELKYNPVIRQLGIHLDCNTGTFEISEGQYTPRLEPEQNPITGELGLAPRFVSCSLMLKKLDAVLALIDERVSQPEQKPALLKTLSKTPSLVEGSVVEGQRAAS